MSNLNIWVAQVSKRSGTYFLPSILSSLPFFLPSFLSCLLACLLTCSLAIPPLCNYVRRNFLAELCDRDDNNPKALSQIRSYRRIYDSEKSTTKQASLAQLGIDEPRGRQRTPFPLPKRHLRCHKAGKRRGMFSGSSPSGCKGSVKHSTAAPQKPQTREQGAREKSESLRKVATNILDHVSN